MAAAIAIAFQKYSIHLPVGQRALQVRWRLDWGALAEMEGDEMRSWEIENYDVEIGTSCRSYLS